MKSNQKCPKCSSVEIIVDAIVMAQGALAGRSPLRVMTFKDPAAAFDKEPQFSSVSAWICKACGFMEIYANRPQDLTLSR
jgi:predicted nucleic-acid-binding Zn-ribbon protein